MRYFIVALLFSMTAGCLQLQEVQYEQVRVIPAPVVYVRQPTIVVMLEEVRGGRLYMYGERPERHSHYRETQYREYIWIDEHGRKIPVYSKAPLERGHHH